MSGDGDIGGSGADRSVEVVRYRSAWPAMFGEARAELARALGPVARTIEHIGSTAVPGLSSKSTIDVLVVVDDITGFVERLDDLAALGYEYRPESSSLGPEAHLFLRKVEGGKRTHHLHVVPSDSHEIEDYRLFRDTLRTDPELAARYERLKLDLVATSGGDRERYVAEKEVWVGRELAILREAREARAAVQVYDRIGQGYAGKRVPEPAWAAQILSALGDAESVLNVGAGTGNYEPDDRFVVALEPSATMLAQRSGSHPAVQGVAEQLPFRDDTFDAGLAILTVHHWSDRASGLAELRRVSLRQVVVAYEPLVAHEFWLADYFPEVRTAPNEADAPTPALLAEHLDVVAVATMWIPADCSDGVAAAYWRRPEAYLDPAVQASMSILALLPEEVRARGTAKLAADLADGSWHARNGHLLQLDRADYGYRLVIAGRAGRVRRRVVPDLIPR